MHYLFCLWLLLPQIAVAQTIKDPLAYPLRQYGLILAISMAGGFVNWFARIKSGQTPVSLMALVGELATSAFAGLLSFWVCAYMDVPLTLTAAIAGMVGHMGGRAIAWAEDRLQRRAERIFLTPKD